MRDEFSGRFWAENHHRLSDGIAEAFHKLSYAFKRLNARQYDAPWRRCDKVTFGRLR